MTDVDDAEDAVIAGLESFFEPPETIEQFFTSSTILKASGVEFERKGKGIWQMNYKRQNYTVTFSPSIFDEMPSLRFMNFGDPLFEDLL
ncbi:hypothetical protein WA1_27120 [Scytonema hofmannii PCC 7110]|uniref:Uncharacterized protein n=1 Tax=Scytonema hofmannii PCC 7110 TaxID=128403 RepID=A0A139X671_9CYAN|nr:hypothetical protein [Scytonema hofmannii]KYC40211.1 hypothetical protein WA1_27120 [Scytonema hofmannii PCC 7110]